MSKVTLTLTARQLSFLEVALETALDNEADPVYYKEFSKLKDMVVDKIEDLEDA